jgi:hypothetical protein
MKGTWRVFMPQVGGGPRIVTGANESLLDANGLPIEINGS